MLNIVILVVYCAGLGLFYFAFRKYGLHQPEPGPFILTLRQIPKGTTGGQKALRVACLFLTIGCIGALLRGGSPGQLALKWKLLALTCTTVMAELFLRVRKRQQGNSKYVASGLARRGSSARVGKENGERN